MPEIIIRTEQLTKNYNGTPALKSLDLEIPEHSIVGFLGPNGAGKSTTIKLLLGLIHPTSGSGTIFGKSIVHESRAIREHVGYLAQQPKFDETMTARQTLRFVAKFFYSNASNAIEKRVDESLALVGLLDKADRPVKGFSGGEMQRLGIAQAQINEPDLLILDEPAAALDPMGRRDVLNIMEQLREKSTIFYSTHILDDVQRVSDRVVILNRGELVAQGPIGVLLNGGDESSVYHIALSGHIDSVFERVKQQSWVKNIQKNLMNGTTHWYVNTGESENANNDLLRLILEENNIQILEYGRQSYELEDVFMRLVEDKE